MQLCMRTLEKPSGIATATRFGPYSFEFMELGMYLTETQKNRIGSHKLPAIF
jgi:hypothetical protein